MGKAYKVPPEPSYGGAIAGGEAPEECQPRVHIPIDPAWMSKLKVGQTATFTVSGTLVSRSEREDEQGSDSDACLECDTVELVKTGGKTTEGAAIFDEMNFVEE